MNPSKTMKRDRIRETHAYTHARTHEKEMRCCEERIHYLRVRVCAQSLHMHLSVVCVRRVCRFFCIHVRKCVSVCVHRLTACPPSPTASQ